MCCYLNNGMTEDRSDVGLDQRWDVWHNRLCQVASLSLLLLAFIWLPIAHSYLSSLILLLIDDLEHYGLTVQYAIALQHHSFALFFLSPILNVIELIPIPALPCPAFRSDQLLWRHLSWPDLIPVKQNRLNRLHSSATLCFLYPTQSTPITPLHHPLNKVHRDRHHSFSLIPLHNMPQHAVANCRGLASTLTAHKLANAETQQRLQYSHVDQRPLELWMEY